MSRDYREMVNVASLLLIVGVCLCGQRDCVVSCENAVNSVSDSSQQT